MIKAFEVKMISSKPQKLQKVSKSHSDQSRVLWLISKSNKKRDQGMEIQFLWYVFNYVPVVYALK